MQGMSASMTESLMQEMQPMPALLGSSAIVTGAESLDVVVLPAKLQFSAVSAVVRFDVCNPTEYKVSYEIRAINPERYRISKFKGKLGPQRRTTVDLTLLDRIPSADKFRVIVQTEDRTRTGYTDFEVCMNAPSETEQRGEDERGFIWDTTPWEKIYNRSRQEKKQSSTENGKKRFQIGLLFPVIIMLSIMRLTLGLLPSHGIFETSKLYAAFFMGMITTFFHMHAAAQKK